MHHPLGTAFRQNRPLAVIIAVGLLLIELEIFALASLKSGRESWLQILDHNGSIVYEADGEHLSEFNRRSFEATYGPLDRYALKRVSRERPFPFRAWFVAAVGIPVGLVLLFAFVARAFIVLSQGGAKNAAQQENEIAAGRGPIDLLHRISRLNIFAIGFLVFFGVFLYWVVPNLLVTLGHIGAETLSRYKWPLLGLFLVFLGIGIWIIYLRYLLAKRTIDRRAEIEKYRLQLEYAPQNERPLRIEFDRTRSIPSLAGPIASDQTDRRGEQDS